MVDTICGIIPAQENIYAIWEMGALTNKKSYAIEKVIAFHFTCDEEEAYLKPICLNTELDSSCSDQIVYYGTAAECEIEMKRLEMMLNVSNKS